MQIYINKNGQQIGPFDYAKVVEMIGNGQVSANDAGIRQGDANWQTLGAMFPNAIQVLPAGFQNAFQASPANFQNAQLAVGEKPRMNKRVVGGIYILSLVLLLVGIFAAIVCLMLEMEYQTLGFTIGAIGLIVAAYLQFLVVHIVAMFYTLYKMWDSIQDGVSTTTGKAIGFLFIPIFQLYWIFKAWGGFPTEYNAFVQRHQLKVPGLNNGIYVFVPIISLLSGFLIFPVIAVPFVFLALISKTCDAVNRLNKGIQNRRAGIGTDLTLADEKETFFSPTMRLTGFGFVGFSIVSVLLFAGFVAWNLNPSPSADEMPETVGTFTKTNNLKFTGSFFGIRKRFTAMYEPTDKTQKKSVVYDVQNVIQDYEKQVYAYSGGKGTINDANGNKIGEFTVTKGNLSIYNGSKKIEIWDLNRSNPYYALPMNFERLEGKITSLTDAEMLEFAKALPANANLKFSEIVATTTGTTPTTSTNTADLKGGREITANEAANYTQTAEEFHALTKKSNTAEYVGKVIDVSGRIYMLGSSPRLKANIYDMLDINMSANQPVTALKEDERIKLKCVGVHKYSRLELGNCLIIENKGIVSAEDTPDFTLTVAEYEKLTSNVFNKYRGKIIDVTGKVKLIGGKGDQLETKSSWLSCRPLAGSENQFTNLIDGAEVKFRGLGDVAGLKHCIVVSK